jgi:hypothetical protein
MRRFANQFRDTQALAQGWSLELRQNRRQSPVSKNWNRAIPSVTRRGGGMTSQEITKAERALCLYDTAHHEAAHAVFAAHLHLPFENTSIEEDGTGWCEFDTRFKRRLRLVVQDRQTKLPRQRSNAELLSKISEWRENLALAMFAGGIAETELCGAAAEDIACGCESDEMEAKATLCREIPVGEFGVVPAVPEAEYESHRDRLKAKAREIIREDAIRAAIFEIADVLLRDEMVPAKTVRNILKDAKREQKLLALIGRYVAGRGAARQGYLFSLGARWRGRRQRCLIFQQMAEMHHSFRPIGRMM